MGMPVYADASALPCFFVDTAIPEPAGDGMVRVTNYNTRNGVLIPQFEVLIHSNKLLLANRNLADMAAKVFKMDLMGTGCGAH